MPLRQAQHALTDAQRLAAIRQSLAEIETVGWTLVEDGEGGFLEAIEEFGVHVTLLRFDAAATPAEKMFIADAVETTRFLLKLVDRAIDKLRTDSSASRAEGTPAGRDMGPDARSGLRPAAGRNAPAGPVHDDRKNYAAEASIKCGEMKFQNFLAQQHGLEPPLTDERTAQKLRSLLGVTSRKALNDDDQAAARWKKLRGEFNDWLRAQR
ncbi:hypothetical protein [Mesorhizobium sp. KR9-304]|uniref:hypothetical protein n=1 Tax=Mesorhizobium sp. KR9-304 TaxID=3156614 RepID=UPI0032B55D22